MFRSSLIGIGLAVAALVAVQVARLRRQRRRRDRRQRRHGRRRPGRRGCAGVAGRRATAVRPGRRERAAAHGDRNRRQRQRLADAGTAGTTGRRHDGRAGRRAARVRQARPERRDGRRDGHGREDGRGVGQRSLPGVRSPESTTCTAEGQRSAQDLRRREQGHQDRDLHGGRLHVRERGADCSFTRPATNLDCYRLPTPVPACPAAGTASTRRLHRPRPARPAPAYMDSRGAASTAHRRLRRRAQVEVRQRQRVAGLRHNPLVSRRPRGMPIAASAVRANFARR